MANKNHLFPQKCTIKNVLFRVDSYASNGGADGYEIFDKNDELIGVVLLDPKYDGRAVIRFLNELKGKYGVWHLIQKNYTFSYLEDRILSDGSITIYID